MDLIKRRSETEFTTSERTIRWVACCQKVPLPAQPVLAVAEVVVVAVVEVSVEGFERRGRDEKRGQETDRFERGQGS